MIKIPKIAYWLPTLFWMVVIFGFSAQPAIHTTDVVWQDFILKKSAHVTEYFILTGLLYYSFTHTTAFSGKKAILLSLVIAIAYACTDEFHQLFVSGREGRIRDVLIDTSGVTFSAIILTFFTPRPKVSV